VVRRSRARGAAILVALAIAVVLIAFSRRAELFPGLGTPVRAATVVLLVFLGWALAQMLGRGIAPMLMRRLEPGTAGTLGFVIRLGTIAGMTVVALRIAGLDARTLAVGGAFTAVVLGLAAQQTLGNLFAGVVLLSARPFRVGDRVRLIGGAMAGQVEGTVGSLGLFYTTLVVGADRTMVPNSVLLQLAVVPLREPERVEMRARLDATVTPTEVQRAWTTGSRCPPGIRPTSPWRSSTAIRSSCALRPPRSGPTTAPGSPPRWSAPFARGSWPTSPAAARGRTDAERPRCALSRPAPRRPRRRSLPREGLWSGA
jgi:hypothetical protein